MPRSAIVLMHGFPNSTFSEALNLNSSNGVSIDNFVFRQIYSETHSLYLRSISVFHPFDRNYHSPTAPPGIYIEKLHANTSHDNGQY